jgi:thiol-disulfide isomerase/thioredoxin
MSKRVRCPWVVMVLGGWILSAGAALSADRTADEILKELDTVKVPTFDGTKRDDKDYIKDFLSKRQEATEKRAALILDLYKAAPDHKRIPALMTERWGSISPVGPKGDELKKEINDVLAETTSPKLKLEGSFVGARIKLIEGQSTGTPDVSAIDEFIKLAPKDPRCASLLYNASNLMRDSKAKAALENRIVKEFRDSPYAGMIEGTRRQREAIGKPFDLEFTDAIKGSSVSIKGLRGKVVIVDFWATWCGPCVAEMPNMKELYAKYHDRGVEFIGVSLDQPVDQGGLDSLKKFVKENEIAWPQYYQGKGWDSEFSKSWGINSIPTMFAVDVDGKLFSIEARGKLETMLPELLKKKDASVGAATGAGGQ